MRTQVGDHRDSVNGLFTDSQLRGEYLGGYRVRVVDDGHSLHLKKADSD